MDCSQVIEKMERETGIEPATSSLGSWYSRLIHLKEASHMARSIEELRRSAWHQELGQKICAAYVAQQQGIGLQTAVNKISLPIGDLWLQIAEIARRSCLSGIETVHTERSATRKPSTA